MIVSLQHTWWLDCGALPKGHLLLPLGLRLIRAVTYVVILSYVVGTYPLHVYIGGKRILNNLLSLPLQPLNAVLAELNGLIIADQVLESLRELLGVITYATFLG